MSAPSYLSTFLWTQQLKGADVFVARFPGHWLVWEPGPWQAPSRQTLNTLKVDTGAATPKAGDALCFQLADAEGSTLRVGREPDNEVQISDGTVSRHHVVLVHRAGAWLARTEGGRAAVLSGVALGAVETSLAAGAQLQLGGVTLSFHDTASLLRRLAQ